MWVTLTWALLTPADQDRVHSGDLLPSLHSLIIISSCLQSIPFFMRAKEISKYSFPPFLILWHACINTRHLVKGVPLGELSKHSWKKKIIKMYVTSSEFPPFLHTPGQLRRARVGVKFPLFSSLASSWCLIDCDGLFFLLLSGPYCVVLPLYPFFIISFLCVFCFLASSAAAPGIPTWNCPSKTWPENICLLKHFSLCTWITKTTVLWTVGCVGVCKNTGGGNWILGAWLWINAFECADLSIFQTDFTSVLKHLQRWDSKSQKRTR